ncbi:MAG TPA: TadE/TadG family type IV pilus assembly protein, partial [Acidimicrobiia bacterium]|nr:TadE/TadG family type IV pilus assembly protein [Acidimicrobiia bacterium]
MADRRPERGAAAVEMAFVAMFLILLVTGVADLGRAIFTYIGVQEAAEEGTMYAS